MSDILLVEDDIIFSSLLTKKLQKAQYTVETAHTVAQAIEKTLEHEFQIILLDLCLQKESGSRILAALRRRGESMPVIIISALSDIESKVYNLNAGADDYLEKPFRMPELLARIQVHLRRRGEQFSSKEMQLHSGDIRLFPRKFLLKRGSEKYPLSPHEMRVLAHLMDHRGKVCSRNDIWESICTHEAPQSNVLNVYVKRLREKIGKDRIQTIYKRGFLFVG